MRLDLDSLFTCGYHTIMLEITERGSRDVERRPAPKAKPDDGVRYAVRQVGPVHEVRRLTFRCGRLVSDQLVVAFMSEAEADKYVYDHSQL